MLAGRPPAGAENFQVGRDVAITPGKIVFRNDLIELIQYEPATKTVSAEPILIIPAWIMKYYILDLEPITRSSRWLVERGHTVFMVSWKNPDQRDREVGLDDYRRLGVKAALDAVSAIVPDRKFIPAVTASAARCWRLPRDAGARRRRPDRKRHPARLADRFRRGRRDHAVPRRRSGDAARRSHVGPGLPGQPADGRRLSGAALERTDLGQVHPRLRAWRPGRDVGDDGLEADQTRMPARMHSEYLHGLYLENRLSSGRYAVEGRKIALRDIAADLRRRHVADHIAPWRSVYKIACSPTPT